jgi:probable rRNA maturation factor
LSPQIDVTVAHPAWRDSVADVEAVCRRAAAGALGHADGGAAGNEISVLLCDDDTMSELNGRYRGVARPTNVLSFANEWSGAGPETRLLGDVAIAFGTVAAEAEAAHLAIVDHLTHMVVHGVLHLLGYDHQTTREAEAMEALEIEILDSLGVADPFAADRHCEEHASPA